MTIRIRQTYCCGLPMQRDVNADRWCCLGCSKETGTLEAYFQAMDIPLLVHEQDEQREQQAIDDARNSGVRVVLP
jgi:hypothetical protein